MLLTYAQRRSGRSAGCPSMVSGTTRTADMSTFSSPRTIGKGGLLFSALAPGVFLCGALLLLSSALTAQEMSRPALNERPIARIIENLQLAPSRHSLAPGIRLKELVTVEGIRSNQLVGYGLVSGLSGTGDNMRNSPNTAQSMRSMMERLGVNIGEQQLKSENVAAVMVTAELPPFVRPGATVDVTVSAMNDATSLLGGTLIVTPLVGADGEIYAVAQGPVNVNGAAATGAAETTVINVPTTGRVAGGATVERGLAFDLSDVPELNLLLRNPDFTTASRIASAINAHFGEGFARPLDMSTVSVSLVPDVRENIAGFLAGIERLTVRPDQVARVVIDERSGTIVMGADVRISTVAISQGGLTIQVREETVAAVPNGPLAAPPIEITNTQTEIFGRPQPAPGNAPPQGAIAEGNVAYMEEGVSLRQLVQGLNDLGVGPRDIIAILQSIRAAGALQADLEFI